MRVLLIFVALGLGAAAFDFWNSASTINHQILSALFGVMATQCLVGSLLPIEQAKRIGRGNIAGHSFRMYSDGSIVVKLEKRSDVTFPSLAAAERILQDHALANGKDTDLRINYEGFGRQG